MNSGHTPPPEDSAAVIAQKVRATLKADGYKPRDLTVRRDRSGVDTILVLIKRLGVVRASVEATIKPLERIYLDDQGRRRPGARHVLIRVEYLPEVIEPFRIEARKVLQALTKTGQRLQIADFIVTLKADGYQVAPARDDRRRLVAPIVYRGLDEAAREIAELVASGGWERFGARLL